MNEALLKKLKETDLFAAPSGDEIKDRSEIRKAQLTKAGITDQSIVAVAPNIMKSGPKVKPYYIVGWVEGVPGHTRIKSFPLRSSAVAFQKLLRTKIVTIEG